jgi:hypothetical protein
MIVSSLNFFLRLFCVLWTFFVFCSLIQAPAVKDWRTKNCAATMHLCTVLSVAATTRRGASCMQSVWKYCAMWADLSFWCVHTFSLSCGEVGEPRPSGLLKHRRLYRTVVVGARGCLKFTTATTSHLWHHLLSSTLTHLRLDLFVSVEF